MLPPPDPFASLMDKMRTGGWDALNQFGSAATQQLSQQSEEAQREARIFIDCFGTEAGQRCLEMLIRKTLMRGPNEVQLGAATAEQYALASAKREGQNNLVFMILQALNYKDKAP